VEEAQELMEAHKVDIQADKRVQDMVGSRVDTLSLGQRPYRRLHAVEEPSEV
jgi:hypothetical protein